MYDPFSADFQHDPYPAYRQLRDEDPVHRHDEPPFWALSRFADVWSAVRSPDFSSAEGLTFYPDEIRTLGLAPTIVMLDPPRHTELRRLVGQAFTPQRVAALEERVREFVRSRVDVVLDAAREGRAVDLHRDFSSPIPTFVLAELLGVPAADRSRFDPWVAALTALPNAGFGVGELAAAGAVAEMFEYFTAVITARRSDPGADLVSALCAAEVDGQRLSDWEVLGFCFVLVAGGNDTTGNLISHGVALLEQEPAQRELLERDPSLLGPAVIEFLRLEGSVQGLARTTLAPARFGDVEIPAGIKVMLLYAAANRDEREFGPTAGQLDVRREIPRHLGFASGVHFCIGSHLARMQARVAFEELLSARMRIGADVAAGQRLQSAFTRGWISLPAVVEPR